MQIELNRFRKTDIFKLSKVYNKAASFSNPWKETDAY